MPKPWKSIPRSALRSPGARARYNRNPDMHEAAKEFSEILGKRFSKKIHTTEDSIRYIFFHSMMSKMKYGPNDIMLEYPHPAIRRARIDTFIHQNSTYPATALEFKFHRAYHGKTMAPIPQHAESLFKDIFRLVRLQKIMPGTDCYLVYVTDHIMMKYYHSLSDSTEKFFDNKKIMTNHKFVKSGDVIESDDVIECNTKLILKQDGKYHVVRVYRILP